MQELFLNYFLFIFNSCCFIHLLFLPLTYQPAARITRDGGKKMRTAYLLTLTQQDNIMPIGKILLSDNNMPLIRKGINKIESQQDNYYEIYATDIHITGDTYKDTVKWAMMEWNIEQLDIL